MLNPGAMDQGILTVGRFDSGYRAGIVAYQYSVAIAEYVVNTSGNVAYWYIQDMTIDAPVGRMNQVADGTSQTVSFPVIKGHVYSTLAHNAVNSAHVYYYAYLQH